MNISFCGVRGSFPVAQPDRMDFGGETTSFRLTGAGGEILLIDAGTGIRNAGAQRDLKRANHTLLLLMTHYHLDHVAGFPLLDAVYRKECRLEVRGPVIGGVDAKQAFDVLFRSPYWPVALDDLAASVRWAGLDAPLRWSGFEITWCGLRHYEGSTAYRIDEPATGAACVVATDVEWQESAAAEKEALLRLCREPSPPGVLVFDGQFTPDNYEAHRGWGHSTWADAVEVARAVNARRLFITHHAPENSDEELCAIEAVAQAAFPGALLAREGTTVEI